MQSKTKTYLDFNKLNEISQNAFCEDLADYKELTDGWFNSAYKIETRKGIKAVIKIAPPKDVLVMGYEKDIMNSEVEVMKLVAEKTNVPVPKIYKYDRSKRIIDQEYFIMEMLEGRPYNLVKGDMETEQKAHVENVLGQYNRQMSQIAGERFGVYSPEQKKFDSWHECFTSMVKMLLEDAERFKTDLKEPYESIMDMVLGLKEVLAVVSKPKLVHWDLWDGNVFVNNGEITGIIDFERALWGDNLMEVYFYSGEDEHFLKGYMPDESDKKFYNIRTTLYGYYMASCMIVECPFRDFEINEEWKINLLIERRQKLRELINSL